MNQTGDFLWLFFSLGKNDSGAKCFLSNMNMPPPPHNKSWQNRQKQILKSMLTVAAECTSRAVAEVKTDKGTDVIVFVDGTWHRRCFSGKNGVVAVLSVNGPNSKVIDTVTLSNYCDACAKGKKRLGADAFEHRYIKHCADKKCAENHAGSAGSMEPEGAETVFRRSEEQHGLRYTQYLGAQKVTASHSPGSKTLICPSMRSSGLQTGMLWSCTEMYGSTADQQSE